MKNADPETADDYLELAERAHSKKKCLEYLRKALELEPENVDVQLQLIVHTLEGKTDEQLPALQRLMDAAAKQLEREGCFKESVGEFWGVLETRPYMRVCYTYFEALITCGMMRRAIDEGQHLLELCDGTGGDGDGADQRIFFTGKFHMDSSVSSFQRKKGFFLEVRSSRGNLCGKPVQAQRLQCFFLHRHIPRNGRLKDPVNLAQIMEIKQEFPNIRLIIAHIGRAYTKEDVGNAFETLDQAPDLMYDFCANCCEYAITEVIRHAGVKHVMYGTDMPILRMRTRRIEENGTYINLVPPGLYGDPKQDRHLREVSAEEAEKITFFLYEELLAFKRACKTLGLTKQDVEDIMYNNAHDLIEGARKSIYG